MAKEEWINSVTALTSSSSRAFFFRSRTCGRPSGTDWGVFPPFSSSATCPPKRWLASGGCGKELFVLIFPVNLWYSEAISPVHIKHYSMSKPENVSSVGTISYGFLRASERSYGGQPIFPPEQRQEGKNWWWAPITYNFQKKMYLKLN